jgi:type II secretory pathway component GspD/PulD (secretin)
VLPVARRAAGEVAAEIAAALAAADEGRRERIRIVASDAANTLFVRADAELLAEVRALLALLDR